MSEPRHTPPELWGIDSSRPGHSPEKLAARGVVRGVIHLSENPAEVQREPAEGKDEDQAEDGFSHLPPLQRNTSLDDVREGLVESRGNDDILFSVAEARRVLGYLAQ